MNKRNLYSTYCIEKTKTKNVTLEKNKNRLHLINKDDSNE